MLGNVLSLFAVILISFFLSIGVYLAQLFIFGLGNDFDAYAKLGEIPIYTAIFSLGILVLKYFVEKNRKKA